VKEKEEMRSVKRVAEETGLMEEQVNSKISTFFRLTGFPWRGFLVPTVMLCEKMETMSKYCSGVKNGCIFGQFGGEENGMTKYFEHTPKSKLSYI
jgi:hypothetical protein